MRQSDYSSSTLPEAALSCRTNLSLELETTHMHAFGNIAFNNDIDQRILKYNFQCNNVMFLSVDFRLFQSINQSINHVILIICSVFRKTHLSDNVQSTIVSGLVSASELRWFWISWQNGIISYGKGSQPDTSSIGFYKDPQPAAVHFMMISSYDITYGFWIIPTYYYLGACAST